MKTSVAAILALLVFGESAAVAAEPVDPAKNLEAVRKAVGTLQSQLDELGKAIADRDKVKETAAASTVAEVAELRGEITAIRQGMAEQRKAMDQAQAEALRLGEENKGLRAKLDQASKERDAAAKARDEVAKARDLAIKERDEAARARDAGSQAKGQTAKARDEAVASSKSSAHSEEIDRLKKELADSWRQVAELERQAATLAATKVEEAAKPSAPTVASAEPPPVPAPEPVPAALGTTAVGGIKQWRQPDGTLFFGDNPPVAGSKLVTVIGGTAPAAPSEAAPRAAAP